MSTRVYKCHTDEPGLAIEFAISEVGRIESMRISAEGDVRAKRTVRHLQGLRKFVAQIGAICEMRNGLLTILPRIDELKLIVRIPDEVSITEVVHFLGRRGQYRTLHVEKGHNVRKTWIDIRMV